MANNANRNRFLDRLNYYTTLVAWSIVLIILGFGLYAGAHYLLVGR